MENKNQKIEQIYSQAIAGQTKLAQRNIKKFKDGKKKQKITNEDGFFLDLVENLCYVKEYRFGQAIDSISKLDKESTALSPAFFKDTKKFLYYISSILAETPFMATIEKSESSLVHEFDFYKYSIFYYYHQKDFKKLSAVFTKVHKIRPNENILFASFYLKLYEIYWQSNFGSFSSQYNTDVEIYFIDAMGTFSPDIFKSFKMNLDLTILTGNKFKSAISRNNMLLVKKLEIVKAILNNNRDAVIAQLDDNNIEYNAIKFIEMLVNVGSIAKLAFYADIVAVYNKKIATLVKIVSLDDIKTKLLNQEAITNYISFCAKNDYNAVLESLLALVKENMTLLQGSINPTISKSNIWTYFNLAKYIKTDENYSVTLLLSYIETFNQTHDFLSIDFLDLIGDSLKIKFTQLVAEADINKETQAFWLTTYDYYSSNGQISFSTGYNYIAKYFKTAKSDQKIEKGQRREKDDWFLLGINILINIHKKFTSSPNKPIDLVLDSSPDKNGGDAVMLSYTLDKQTETSYLLFLMYVLEAGKKYSPYNFDTTKNLAYIFSQLDLNQRNISLFYEEDYKSNQHETLSPIFFNGLIGLNLQVDEFFDKYNNYFNTYSENYREAGKNAYCLAKFGNMNVFAEMDTYNFCFSRSYLKGLIYMNLKSRALNELLKNPDDSESKSNVSYFMTKLDNFNNWRYLNWNLDDFDNTLGLLNNIAFAKLFSAFDDTIYSMITQPNSPNDQLHSNLSLMRKSIESIKNFDVSKQYTIVRRNTYSYQLDKQVQKANDWMQGLLDLDEVKHFMDVYYQYIAMFKTICGNTDKDGDVKNLIDKLDYFSNYEFPSNHIFKYVLLRLIDSMSKISGLISVLGKVVSPNLGSLLKESLKRLVDKLKNSFQKDEDLMGNDILTLVEKLKAGDNTALFSRSNELEKGLRDDEQFAVLKNCFYISGLK